MNLREYFRKIREVESSIEESEIIVSSLRTPDGGKAGVLTEVPRFIGAQMIVEGRAIKATREECRLFQERGRAERAAAQQAEVASKLQVTVVTEKPQPAEQSSRLDVNRK